MAANIKFVDKATIVEIFGGEDSDGPQSVSNSESEDKDDMSDEGSNTEEENEEHLWVVGALEPRSFEFTADRGLKMDLPDNPSFSNYFYLPFPDNLIHEIARQTNKYARETITSLRARNPLSLTHDLGVGPDYRYGPCDSGEHPGSLVH